MNNKQMGNRFEQDFCEILFQEGFWTHNLAQNQAGQPADVVAVRNGKPYLIDCKVCSGKGFALDRIESNQDSSMILWKQCGNGEGWFAFLIGENIYMIQHIALKACQAHVSLLRNADIEEGGIPLSDWLEWSQK